MFAGTGPRAGRRMGSCGWGTLSLQRGVAVGRWSRPHTSKNNDGHVSHRLRSGPAALQGPAAGLHCACAVRRWSRGGGRSSRLDCVRRHDGRSRFRRKGAGGGHPRRLRSVSRVRRRRLSAPAGPGARLVRDARTCLGTPPVAPTMAATACDSSLAVTLGTWTYTAKDSKTADTGQYLTAWRRSENGDWQIVLDQTLALPTLPVLGASATSECDDPGSVSRPTARRRAQAELRAAHRADERDHDDCGAGSSRRRR